MKPRRPKTTHAAVTHAAWLACQRVGVLRYGRRDLQQRAHSGTRKDVERRACRGRHSCE